MTNIFDALFEIDPAVEARRHYSVVSFWDDTEISETDERQNVAYVGYSRDMTEGFHSIWIVPGTA